MDIPSISCSLCNGNVESSSHIFFDCDFAKEVWRLVRIWCGIPLPTFTSYGHWMSWFTSWQAPKEKSRRLSIIVAASFMWIWRFRNSVVFCPHPLRKSDMFNNICSSSISLLFYRGRMPCSWMSTTMELILAKCECCGLTEECTFEYIYKIRERYNGKWICGLCGEAIKDEIARGEKLISTKEAMARLINFCKESKPSNKMTEPTIHLIAAMRQIMLRSLDSPRALRSMPNSPLRVDRIVVTQIFRLRRRPLAIELSLPRALPGSQLKRVLTPPVDATSNWTWQLAKAHMPLATGPGSWLKRMSALTMLGFTSFHTTAIQNWVQTYVNRYYPDLSLVCNDRELQAWYAEVINVGHADLRYENWWPTLANAEDLTAILTTIIWLASAQHAALNFGQYPYGGYIPNRPPRMRRLIPDENDPEYASFLEDPQNYFLLALPSMLQSTKYMAMVDTLSTHSPDEEYIGERQRDTWSGDAEMVEAFYGFASEIQRIEKKIEKRNRDMSLKNRCGAGVLPYELLAPSSEPGVTCRGIPNSVSI
ncbi:linoleate 13S-lipoxygenase 3-1, chloroplastic [Tanacetum coccineum]